MPQMIKGSSSRLKNDTTGMSLVAIYLLILDECHLADSAITVRDHVEFHLVKLDQGLTLGFEGGASKHAEHFVKNINWIA